jgi:hypothetical protein
MNCRRGLFRLLIVGAAFIAIDVVFVSYPESMASGVPLVMLIFVASLVWAISGFAAKRS